MKKLNPMVLKNLMISIRKQDQYVPFRLPKVIYAMIKEDAHRQRCTVSELIRDMVLDKYFDKCIDMCMDRGEKENL